MLTVWSGQPFWPMEERDALRVIILTLLQFTVSLVHVVILGSSNFVLWKYMNDIHAKSHLSGLKRRVMIDRVFPANPTSDPDCQWP